MTSNSIKVIDVPQLSAQHWNLLVDEMDMNVDNDNLLSNDDQLDSDEQSDNEDDNNIISSP